MRSPKGLLASTILALGIAGSQEFALAEQTAVTTQVTVTSERIYDSPEMKVATSSENQAAIIAAKTPEEMYQNFLSEMGMSDGVNYRDDGSMFFVSFSETTVDDPKIENWIQVRSIAYSKSILNAKAQIADLVATEIASERSSEVMQIGGDVAPPILDAPVKQLSIMDKALALTDKSLDAEIKKFDPQWDGTGMSHEEKRKRIVTMQEQYKASIAARSAMYLSGALPIFVAEGNDIDGNYTVGAALVWSPRTQMVASAVGSGNVQLPLDTPEPTIREQIQAKLNADPNFLAVSQGVRIWTNEKGEQAVISFAAVDRTKSKQLNSRRAGTVARNMIAQFVAEDVTATEELEEHQTSQTLQNGAVESFDEGEFSTKVKARTGTINLQGVGKVFSWKGKHPESNADMQVDVYAWTPQSRIDAQQMQQISNQQQERMSRQGVPLGGSQGGNVTATGGSTRTGATTKKSKW